MIKPIFFLFSQNPNRSERPEIRFYGAADSLSVIEYILGSCEELEPGAFMVTARFVHEQADSLRSALAAAEFDAEAEDKIEALLETYLFTASEVEPSPDVIDDPMDGDHDSSMASAGMGTGEDYGDFG